MAHTPKYDANRFHPVQKPSATRDALKAKAGSRASRREPVSIDYGDGEPVVLDARPPLAGAMWRIQETGYTAESDDGGKSVMVPSKFWPAIIAAAYVEHDSNTPVWGFINPNTGEHQWSEDDEAEIAALPMGVASQLVGPALHALGSAQEVRDDLKNGSSEADTAASSSTSPAS